MVATAATVVYVNQSDFANMPVSLPPLEEQKAIAEYLDRKTIEIDNQKAKIQQAINLLKEYRTALITNAVTGKIDVRQVSIPPNPDPSAFMGRADWSPPTLLRNGESLQRFL